MKITFDSGDVGFLQDALAEGLMKAVRTLARENLFQEPLTKALITAGRQLAKDGLFNGGYKPPEQIALEEEESRADYDYAVIEKRGKEVDEQRVKARTVGEAIREARRKRGWGGRVMSCSIVATPLFNGQTSIPLPSHLVQAREPERPAPPPVQPPALEPPPAAPPVEAPAPQEKKKQPRTNLATILKTTGERPHGYIPRDEAVVLVGGGDSGQARLSKWIIEEHMPAIIVCGTGLPPTKGLPGRVYVEKKWLLERDDLRKLNALTHPGRRPNGVSRVNGTERHADA